MTETDEERIKAMVEEANRLQKVGKYEEALDILFGVSEEVSSFFPEGGVKQSLFGLVYHYTGSTLQRMGQYDRAIVALGGAVEFREQDPVAKAYSMFQLFICKQYGELSISDGEVEDTKAALTAAMANKAATIADIGNMMQNVAYVEQVKGDTEKAILFYEMTLKPRETAGDARGYALTQARLAECHLKIGSDKEVIWKYAGSALEYFEKTGDVERVKQINTVLGWK